MSTSAAPLTPVRATMFMPGGDSEDHGRAGHEEGLGRDDHLNELFSIETQKWRS